MNYEAFFVLSVLWLSIPPRENTRSEFHTRVFRESAGIFTSRHVCNKLVVSSLLRIDFHKLATAWYQQTCAKLLTSLLQTCCEQPCYSIVTTTSLQVRQQVATSLSQQAGTSSANTSCWQVVGTALLQVCCRLVTTCAFLRVFLLLTSFASWSSACFILIEFSLHCRLLHSWSLIDSIVLVTRHFTISTDDPGLRIERFEILNKRWIFHEPLIIESIPHFVK